jgi:hypothetical protein
MRMAASWFGSSRITSSTIHRIQGCGAMSSPLAGSPQIVLSAQPSVDGPAPPDSWLSIGAGRRQTPPQPGDQASGSIMPIVCA